MLSRCRGIIYIITENHKLLNVCVCGLNNLEFFELQFNNKELKNLNCVKYKNLTRILVATLFFRFKTNEKFKDLT